KTKYQILRRRLFSHTEKCAARHFRKRDQVVSAFGRRHTLAQKDTKRLKCFASRSALEIQDCPLPGVHELLILNSDVGHGKQAKTEIQEWSSQDTLRFSHRRPSVALRVQFRCFEYD